MKKEQAILWLDKLFVKIPAEQDRSVWSQSECPLQPWTHDGQSGPKVFGIKNEAGDSVCKCFSCGFAGSQSDLLNRIRYLNKQVHHHDYPMGWLFDTLMEAEANADLELDTPSIEAVLTATKKEITVFPEWWLDSFAPWHSDPDSIAYLKERNVPDAVADALDIRYDSTQRRVCFPVRDFHKRLVGLHGRAIDVGVEPRYRMYRYAKVNNPECWLGEEWVDLNKPVLAVEGPMDLAQVVRVYRNTVSPLFAVPGPEKMRRMGSVMQWGTMLDHGKAGDTGRERFGKSYPHAVITHMLPPLGMDPGKTPVETLAEIIGESFDLDDTV